MIVTKTQTHQEKGEYKPTSLDQEKQEADFRLLQVSSYYIQMEGRKRGNSKLSEA